MPGIGFDPKVVASEAVFVHLEIGKKVNAKEA